MWSYVHREFFLPYLGQCINVLNYNNNYLKQICNDKALYSIDKKNISIADNLSLYKNYETISIIVSL